MGKSIEQLVNQEVMRWLRAQETKRAAEPRVERDIQQPMITISREYGSYGAELGGAVAQRLGIEFLEQELVHQIAARADVRRHVVEALDERVQSRLELWVDDLIRLRHFRQSDYVDNLTKTLLALARQNSAVVVGRGGNLILDKSRTLRVRCFAPLEYRVAHVATREGIDEDAARIKIESIDGQRREFYESNFGVDITSPLHFDLMLNMANLSPEEGVETVARLFEYRFRSHHEAR